MKELRKFVFQFFQENKKVLQDFYPGLNEHRLCQEILTLPHFGCSNPIEILSAPYLPSVHDPLTEFFKDILEGRPFGHLLQRASFYGHTFHVGPEVLIPRQETELLVERALGELKKLKKMGPFSDSENGILRIADMGVGPGCILLSTLIEHGEKCMGVGIDINPFAIELSQRNAFYLQYKMHPDTQVNFLLGDRFFDLKTRFHMILSNPPYIHRKKDDPFVHWATRKFDPHEALYLDDEIYWSWFEVLLGQSLERLFDGGVFIMEGHEFHLEEMAKLAKRLGFSEVEVWPDLTGRLRFIQGKK